jgi:hypothetical protein
MAAPSTALSGSGSTECRRVHRNAHPGPLRPVRTSGTGTRTPEPTWNLLLRQVEVPQGREAIPFVRPREGPGGTDDPPCTATTRARKKAPGRSPRAVRAHSERLRRRWQPWTVAGRPSRGRGIAAGTRLHRIARYLRAPAKDGGVYERRRYVDRAHRPMGRQARPGRLGSASSTRPSSRRAGRRSAPTCCCMQRSGHHRRCSPWARAMSHVPHPSTPSSRTSRARSSRCTCWGHAWLEVFPHVPPVTECRRTFAIRSQVSSQMGASASPGCRHSSATPI